MLTRDEQELVQRLQQGEPDAVDQLCALYTDRLYRHIFHRVGQDSDAAEDVLQETLLAALRGIKRFQGKARLATWLYSIAGHKAADWHRHQARQRRWQQPSSASLEELSKIDEAPLPEEVVQRKDVRAAVQAALEQLPPHYHEVLRLKYIQDRSVAEISEITGKSFKSVESTLVRARRALRKLLAPMVKR